MYQLKTQDSNDSVKKYSDALWKQYNTGRVPVIPDIKLRSPGEGDLIRGRNPVEYAKAMAAAGAPVLSVVTETTHFGGSLELLQKIALAASVPILRRREVW